MTELEYLLIEKFLDNTLSDEERKLFDQKISELKEFSEEVKFQAEVASFLHAIGKSSIKNDVQQIYAKYKEEQVEPSTTKSISLYTYTTKWWMVAASIGIIVVSLVVVLFLDFKKPYETAFDDYYKPYKGLIVTRNSTMPLVSDIVSGKSFYGTGNYEKALAYFLKARPAFKERTLRKQLDLLISNCYLNMGDDMKALFYLNQIEREANATFAVDSRNWYKALTYLKMGNIVNSKLILEKIKMSNSLYANDAEKLLSEKAFSD